MDNDMVCNIQECRKKLSSFAWVTSCSHAFCDDCARGEFTQANKCPLCQDNLSTSKYDLIRTDLQPSEEYKSTALSGLKPSVIMEICSRALSFWSFQTCQEVAYLEGSVAKAKEQRLALEEFVNQRASETRATVKSLKGRLKGEQKEIESLRSKLRDLQDKLEEKTRQHSKLQNSYDTMRRQSITKMADSHRSNGDSSTFNNSYNTNTGTGSSGLLMMSDRDGEFRRPMLPLYTSRTDLRSVPRPSPCHSTRPLPLLSPRNRADMETSDSRQSRRRRHEDENSSGDSRHERMFDRGRSYSPSAHDKSRRFNRLF